MSEGMELPADVWQALRHMSSLHEHIAQILKEQLGRLHDDVALLRAENMLLRSGDAQPQEIRTSMSELRDVGSAAGGHRTACRPSIDCERSIMARPIIKNVCQPNDDISPTEFGETPVSETPRLSDLLCKSVDEYHASGSESLPVLADDGTRPSTCIFEVSQDSFEASQEDPPNSMQVQPSTRDSASENCLETYDPMPQQLSHCFSRQGTHLWSINVLWDSLSVDKKCSAAMQAMHSVTANKKQRFATEAFDHTAEKASCCMMAPTCAFRVCFDVLGMILLLYDMIVMPLSAFSLPHFFWAAVMDTIITSYWTFDILASCSTGMHIGGELVTERRRVVKVYLITWFPFDMFLVVLGWVDIAAYTSESGVFRWIRAVKGIRILRMVKLRDIIRNQCEHIAMQLHWILHVSGFSTFFLLCVHVLSCLWFAIGDSAQDGWVQFYVPDASFSDRYTFAMHWAMSSFHSNSDIACQNLKERVFASVATVVAMVTVILFTASITNLLVEFQMKNQNRARENEELRRYLQERGVATHLRVSVKRHAQIRESGLAYVLEEDVTVLAALPQNLVNELRAHARAPILSKLTLFGQLGEAYHRTLAQVCQSMGESRLHPDETLFRMTDACERALFVAKGQLEYKHFGSASCTMEWLKVGPGSCVSEAALWVQNWLNQGDLACNSHGLIYSLKVGDFNRVVLLHEVSHSTVRTYIQDFICHINSLEREDLTDISMDILKEPSGSEQPRSMFQRRKMLYQRSESSLSLALRTFTLKFSSLRSRSMD